MCYWNLSKILKAKKQNAINYLEKEITAYYYYVKCQ